NNHNNNHNHSNHKNVNGGGGGGGGHITSSATGGVPLGSSTSAAIDMAGVPPTYTELDFTNPQWTPVVIRADPVAAMYAANAVDEICCPEYVPDRKHLVYIIDLPVPAVGGGGGGGNRDSYNNNSSLRHASIVGKRGNTLVQLSADHQCRIMVPPKQLGHNVIQLEAPLQECCSCLDAIAAKLQLGSNSNYTTATTTAATTNNSGSEEKELHNGPKISTSPSKNSKNSTTNNNNNKANPNSKPTNNFSITLVIQPLPSQTKLRNIARKTETKILKKRMSKYQQQKHQEQHPQHQQQHSEKPQKPSEDNNEVEQQQQQQQQDVQEDREQEPELQSGESDTKDKNPESWRLTIVANTEKKATKALEMLKVLNTKGYEVDVVKPVSESNRGNVCDGSTHSTGDRDDINESAGTTAASAETATATAKEDISDFPDAISTTVEEGNNTTATTPTTTHFNKNTSTKNNTRGGKNKRKPRHHKATSGRGGNNNRQQQQQVPPTTTTTASVTTD
ncbi:MAG: hypothetical protein ACI8RD_007267, partial [Bacillariaceae sp.]